MVANKKQFGTLPLFLAAAAFFNSTFVSASVELQSAGQNSRSPIKVVYPNGLALDRTGNLYITDIGTHRVLKLGRGGRLTVIAGTGTSGFSGDGGPAAKAQLSSPHDLTFDREGNLVIADSGNHRVRRIDRQGVIATIAGDGKALQSNYNGEVPATSLNNPQSIALDREGNLLIADTFNHVVRRLGPDGKLPVFAGSVAGFGGDGGPATKAQISLPMAVACGPDGSVYISDAGNSRIRRVGSDGVIRTIAGYGPPQDTYGGGYGGDGGPAEKGKIFSATDLKLDASGNLYISDSGNHRIRVVRNGVIDTVAGSGRQGFTGDGGKALSAELNAPQKIAIAADGGLFIADRANQRVRKVDGRGVINSVAGDARPTGFILQP
jgi:sugar lactone lactonase YvrE